MNARMSENARSAVYTLALAFFAMLVVLGVLFLMILQGVTSLDKHLLETNTRLDRIISLLRYDPLDPTQHVHLLQDPCIVKDPNDLCPQDCAWCQAPDPTWNPFRGHVGVPEDWSDHLTGKKGTP